VASLQTPFAAALERIVHPRRVMPAFVFALAVLLLVGGLSWRSIDSLLATNALVTHSYTVLERLQSLAGDLRDAEAGEHSFVISGRDEFRAAYQAAVSRLPRHLAELRHLLTDSPVQIRRVDELEASIGRLLDFYRRVAEARRYSGAQAASRLVTGGEGEREMEAIRDVLVQAERDERTLLAERAARSQQSARETLRNLTVAGVAAVGLLVVAAFLVRRDMRERVRVAGELTEVNNRLAGILERAQERGDEIARLAELSQLLQTCQLPEEAYRVIERAAPALVGRSGALFLVNSSGMLENHASWGGEIARTEPMFGPVDCWALRRNRVHDAGLDRSAPRCGHLLGLEDMHTTCVPLTAQGESLGVLVLIEPLVQAETAAKDGNPEEQADRRRTVTATAEQIALALANLRLRDTLKSQSIRDPLTGLFNRRFLEESLERECRRSIRANRPLSVMMLDIDHFKRFNDTFGHDAGDAVLREVGAVLRSFFRGEDVACRYGGEEFALVLADTSADGALARASQLREQVHQLSLSFRRQALGPVTISIGIATVPLHASTADTLLRVADRALYRAKHEGRDRVVLADTTEMAEGALADSGLS
jgi:diguanylate cyclase (GGDEF)-like protein